MRTRNQVLADSYALLSPTHLAHWNVEGPGFFALHPAFQTQYEELFVAIDELQALEATCTAALEPPPAPSPFSTSPSRPPQPGHVLDDPRVPLDNNPAECPTAGTKGALLRRAAS